MDLDKRIRLHALKNAASYGGKASSGAVIGKVLGEFPEWKMKTPELSKKVNLIIAEVNKMEADAQREELERDGADLLERKKEERNIFAFLGIKPGDKVVTAFPPGPEKYPHIGHAKALLLNHMLARQYGGRFILRFEDTNPNLVQGIFYDIMLENFRWLGVEWDELMYASDHMALFYKMCDKAIISGDAYVCNCDEEKIKLSREKGVACDCRSRSPDENMELWKEMPKVPEGHAIVRLRIDLKHQNSTMRDPTIFRILDKEHARHGHKYRVWPNYDWQNSIMDGYFGVTHRVRSKEFELRSELQRYIQKLLGLHSTVTYEFGRFNLEGVESSGRVIREKIEKGELLGWDDPSLTTLVALRRRGFLPEAIKNFVISTGISKAEAKLTWDDFIMHNKRLLDATADRFFFVREPQELWVKGATEFPVELNLHPEHRKGGRRFITHDIFWVPKTDFGLMEEGKIYRLMDCLNFRKQKDGFEFVDRSVETYKKKGERIMHWLPKNPDDSELVPVEVMMNDKTVISGLAEHGVAHVKQGSVVQFERFGFCRFDRAEKGEDGKVKRIFWFTHG